MTERRWRPTAVPVSRAEHHIHEAEAWLPTAKPNLNTSREDCGIATLDVTNLSVMRDVLESDTITVAARGDAPVDAYGFEFDLSLPDAVDLAQQILIAAQPLGRRDTTENRTESATGGTTN